MDQEKRGEDARLRTRNVDVGERIGRRPPNAQSSGPANLEEQKKQLAQRMEANETLLRASMELEDAMILRELDRIPCLPGEVCLALSCSGL